MRGVRGEGHACRVEATTREQVVRENNESCSGSVRYESRATRDRAERKRESDSEGTEIYHVFFI
jgi:hypothetical protein